jgi:hypothetical protein
MGPLENTRLVVDGLRKEPLSPNQARSSQTLKRMRYFIEITCAREDNTQPQIYANETRISVFHEQS